MDRISESGMSKAIVGLGNPGEEYKFTRHNLGFMAIDRISKSLGINMTTRRFKGLIGEKEISGIRLIVAKPKTYMNLSGSMVRPLMSSHGIKPGDLLVMADDFNLPLGTIRLRRNGGAGGHKGLISIINEIGTEEFPRLRIGIGPLPQDVDPMTFVLERFNESESRLIPDILENVRSAASLFIESGIDAAMSKYNSKEMQVELDSQGGISNGEMAPGK